MLSHTPRVIRLWEVSRMRVLSFKVEDDLLELLEDYARRRNIPKSEVIRRALRQYINSDKDRPYVGKYIKIYS
jgi:metal-responsive CopG/Arc/MetJ family transcriptional regulator